MEQESFEVWEVQNFCINFVQVVETQVDPHESFGLAVDKYSPESVIQASDRSNFIVVEEQAVHIVIYFFLSFFLNLSIVNLPASMNVFLLLQTHVMV